MAVSELNSAMKPLPSTPYILQNLTASAVIYDILGSVIPRLQDRTALDIHTWPHLFAPLPLIVFTAYLARRPNTHYLRLTLLPINILCCLRAGFGFVWLDPRYNNFNYAAGQFFLFACPATRLTSMITQPSFRWQLSREG